MTSDAKTICEAIEKWLRDVPGDDGAPECQRDVTRWDEEKDDVVILPHVVYLDGNLDIMKLAEHLAELFGDHIPNGGVYKQ